LHHRLSVDPRNEDIALYLPERFKNDSDADIKELIAHYPLATLISVVDGEPFISHVPLTTKDSGTDFTLIGHVARANPHWRYLSGANVTAIFNGPSTYITPTWYEKNDVPTWNYATVHVKGTASVTHEADKIISYLQSLTKAVEPDNGWAFWVPDDLKASDDLSAAIVGFEIKPTEIRAKFKLSQNRSVADRRGVIKGLSSRQDDNSAAVKRLMENRL